MKKLLLATTLSLAFSGVAQAIPVTLQFTATDFRSWFGTASPYTSISGTIVYEAASLTAPIQSLTSVDLNIGGTAFSVANVGIQSPYDANYPNMSALGGVISANDRVGSMFGGTTDFWLLFYNDRGTGYQFVYVDEQYPDQGWSVGPDGGRFSQFSLTASTATPPNASSVPEPASLAMLGLGLAGLFAVRRRRSANLAG